MEQNTLVSDIEMIYNTNMNIAYKSNNNIVYSCKYHVVWCPKYRRKILTNGIDTRLKELLLEYAANVSVDIMEMEIMPAMYTYSWRQTLSSVFTKRLNH